MLSNTMNPLQFIQFSVMWGLEPISDTNKYQFRKYLFATLNFLMLKLSLMHKRKKFQAVMNSLII